MRAIIVTLVLLALRIEPSAAPGGGTIKGRVVVTNGTKAGNTSDVWIYLERIDGPRKKPAATKQEIIQKNRVFSPRVHVVPVGSTIAFPNRDDRDHNVFSPPSKPTDPFFDLGRYGKNNTNSHEFLDAGEFKIYCDIHPQMAATVKVVKSDLIFPVTNGSYSASGVPPGRYKVVAWRPDSDEVREQIDVKEGGVVEVPDLHLKEKPAKPHTHQDGRPYGPYDDRL